MRTTRLAAALAAAVLVLGVSISVAAQEAQLFIVHCSHGQTIARALELGDARKPLVLVVRGTCKENVVITRDHVTLQGDPPRVAAVQAANPKAHAITVMATWIGINGLTVTGGLNGIWTAGVSYLSVKNSVIQNAVQAGINLNNSFGRIGGSTIKSNGSDGLMLQTAQAVVLNTEISMNAGSGIRLNGSSSLDVSGGTISANGTSGVSAYRSDASITGTAITGNGSNGVEAYGSSHASLQGNTITGNGTKAPNDPNFLSGVVVHASNLDLSGNQITNHPGTGVRASAATVTSNDNSVAGNAGGGVLMYPASRLVMSGDTINNNGGFGLVLSLNSVAQVLGSKVQFNTNDGIQLQFGSKLNLVAVETVSGGNSGYGLQCVDAESSVVGLQMLSFSPPNGQGGVSPGCTGF